MATKAEERSERPVGFNDPVTGELPEEALAANQMFTPEQLPDPEAWKASGLAGAPPTVPAHLVLDTEEDENAMYHPLAPEPGHALRAATAAGVKERLTGWVESAEETRERLSQSVAQPEPDEVSRRVQGSSAAQAKILAGDDPDKAVKAVEKEQEKADKQIEKGKA